MVADTGFDHAVGPTPILGDLFDVAFKGNRRAIAILRGARERTPPDWTPVRVALSCASA
jgi:hypothetical protein